MKQDRFTARSAIGQGSSAEVFKALDETTQREVAIKLLFREAGKPLNELRVGRTLNHSSIIPIYEFIEEDGRSGIVMQYASKGNLRTRMQTGPMPLQECLVILEDIAAGLAVAHANNIIHRDVKPENIVFTGDGKAKLTDFGHAWFLENTNSPNTLVGAGTPAYMAPEKESTARSDIYSLGVVLYEMLAGGLPESTILPAAVPWHVRRTLLRCIQRDPSLRPPTVPDLLNELKEPWPLRPLPKFIWIPVIATALAVSAGVDWWAYYTFVNPPATATPHVEKTEKSATVAKRPTVAVFFEGNTGQGFIQALSQAGRFEIVERGQLKRALSEFDLTKTGKVDLATAQHAGRIVGAQFLLFGVVESTPTETSVAARIVETETLINKGIDTIEAGAGANPIELAKTLAGRFHL